MVYPIDIHWSETKSTQNFNIFIITIIGQSTYMNRNKINHTQFDIDIWTKTQPNNKLRANSKSSCTLTKPETRNTLNIQLTSSRRGLCSVSMFLFCAEWLYCNSRTTLIHTVVFVSMGVRAMAVMVCVFVCFASAPSCVCLCVRVYLLCANAVTFVKNFHFWSWTERSTTLLSSRLLHSR